MVNFACLIPGCNYIIEDAAVGVQPAAYVVAVDLQKLQTVIFLTKQQTHWTNTSQRQVKLEKSFLTTIN